MENAKIYEIPGCISCRLKFTLGKAKPFEAYFDGGVPDKGIPATYVAYGLGRQLAIENSELFAKGKIREVKKDKKTAVKIVTTPTTNKSEVKSETKVSDSGSKSYPEVTSVIEAVAILKGEYGVSATRLKSEASVLRAAEEHNVSFPNMK